MNDDKLNCKILLHSGNTCDTWISRFNKWRNSGSNNRIQFPWFGVIRDSQKRNNNMSINVHDSSVLDRNIDPELIEEQFKAYIDSGGSREFILSRNDIEELHISMGDKLFHQFISSMEITVDIQGKEYIDSFNKDFTPKPKEVFEDNKEEVKVGSVIERLDKEYLNYKNHLYGDPRYTGRKPKYLILSRDVYIKLQNEVEGIYKTNSKKSKRPYFNDIEYEIINNMKYRGIPICIYESHEKKNILDFV